MHSRKAPSEKTSSPININLDGVYKLSGGVLSEKIWGIYGKKLTPGSSCFTITTNEGAFLIFCNLGLKIFWHGSGSSAQP